MIWALHGNLGHPGDWAGTQRDLPGSPWVTPSLWNPRPEPFHVWADAFNRRVRCEDADPVLIGYSLGGRLAMHAATAAESPWKAVVLVSAHPGLSAMSSREQRLSEDRQWAALLRTGPVRSFLDQWNARTTLQADPPASDQWQTVSEAREAISEGFTVWSLGVQEDLRSALGRCGIPQLWVAGALDRKFARLMEDTATRIPSASYREIEGCGHRVPLRNPSRLAECIRAFLDSL
ncbi:MAG: alpha/beta fold hydrolase [Verrucomicrobia bacterium]|nr:alpha/beta fold hydrolase [Verrucomicrobiota bacterium]